MSQITPGEARSRQTAYLATEHWWRSRVEALVSGWDLQPRPTAEQCIEDIKRLIAERNPR